MNRTLPTDADVDAFLAANAGARLGECRTLIDLMTEETGEPPRMWGPSIVGFGSYHYRYESGREGDSCLVGFSPRATEFSIYLTGVYFADSKPQADALLAQLGRHRMGKACLYVKRLKDIDLDMLRRLVALSIDALRRHYG